MNNSVYFEFVCFKAKDLPPPEHNSLPFHPSRPNTNIPNFSLPGFIVLELRQLRPLQSRCCFLAEKELKITSSVPRVHIDKTVLELCDYLQKKRFYVIFFRLGGFTKVDISLLFRNFCYDLYIGAGKLHFQLS